MGILCHWRGGTLMSVRLTVQGSGYIDFTDLPLPSTAHDNSVLGYIDLNGGKTSYSVSLVKIKLVLEGENQFSFSLIDIPNPTEHITKGLIKPLVSVPAASASIFSSMIKQDHVPFPQPPGRGKSVETIRALGRQFFPFSECSFELAMAVYDSTTFSFIRLVLFSMFEYVTIWTSKGSGLLDLNSIAEAIFAMDWGQYNPQNPVYMKSFLMRPAKSKEEVLEKLKTVDQDPDRM
ncbi:hypothetical protein RSAG8_11537, partial [Rhizoctonia solani AG-8 WAC10335]